MEGNELSDLVSSADEDEDEDEGTGITASQRKYRRLIKSIREYLKKKLPIYSVPNGK